MPLFPLVPAMVAATALLTIVGAKFGMSATTAWRISVGVVEAGDKAPVTLATGTNFLVTGL